ncbi:MAG: OmpA family protein [Marinibacterium sp.]|nr:OmpA family protein [Marinibacterium sp.]
MSISKSTLAVCAAGLMALGACTDPATLDSAVANPNQNRNAGAGIGALAGAAVGALAADSAAKGALIGAAVGAGAGALIGNDLDKQAAELRQQLANDGITVTNTGDRLVVTLPQDITFATDSSTVTPALQADISRVAANLLNYPKSNVQVIGHTDNTGDAAYNQTLSVQRASAVANILFAGGVPDTRVSVFGRGEDQPVASNLTPEGRAQNRRVDIVVIPQKTS